MTPQSLSHAVLSWNSPLNSCLVISYIIALTNVTDGNATYTYNTTTNTTSMTLSGLTKGAEHFFTVAAMDSEGRVGEESVHSKVVIDDSKDASCHITVQLWIPLFPYSIAHKVYSKI